MSFLIWTVLYLLVGFAFSRHETEDMKKWSRKKGDYRSDDPWNLVGVLLMLFWLPIIVLYAVCYILGGIRGSYEAIHYGRLQRKRGFGRELGVHEKLSSDPTDLINWREVEIGKTCAYGCKIYENSKTTERVLAHNSAYGCTK